MIRIEKERCTGCGICIRKCPFGALKMEEGVPVVSDSCLECNACANECPAGAIRKDEESLKAEDIGTYHDVFVLAELEPLSGKVQKVTLELIAEGRRIADKMGEKQKTLLLCSQMPEDIEERAGRAGCDEIILVKDQMLKEYNTDLYADIVTRICQRYRPSVLLIPATETGRDLAPRVSARLQTGLTADCTGFDVDQEGNLIQIRPTYGGNIMASIISPGCRPQMASVRPNVFAAETEVNQKLAVIKEEHIAIDPGSKRTRRTSLEENPKSYKNVAESDMVIVAGYGVGSAENFKKIERMAVKMGAAIGATRKVVDEGWAPFDIQVGQTGKTIAPELYIGFGVSGALQHTIGLRNAKYVVAVNSDPAAPIFAMCDQAILGDCVDIAEHMERLLDGKEG